MRCITSWTACAEKFDCSPKGFEPGSLLAREKSEKLGVGGFVRALDLLMQRANLFVDRLDRGAEFFVDRLGGGLLAVGEAEVIGEGVGFERRRRTVGARRALRECAACDEKSDDCNDAFHGPQYRAAARQRLHERERTS